MLCYIVRDGRLLVFRHTDYSCEEVGIQVPAGSIRDGERPEDAALREAREETGLTDFKVVRKLGETEYDMTPYRAGVQRRHVFECFWIPLSAAHGLQSGQGALPGRLFD